MAARTAGRKGRPYRRIRLWILQKYHGICHICWHPDATQVDHTPPRKELVRLGLDPNNPKYLRPAHGGELGCPYCPRDARGRPRRCNQIKGTKPTAKAAPPAPLVTSRRW